VPACADRRNGTYLFYQVSPLVVRDIIGQFGYQHPAKKGHLVLLAIRNDGTLGRMHKQTLPVRSSVVDAQFDASGNFLYLLTGNGVRPFRVRQDGSIMPIGSRSFHAGRGPLGMVYVRR